MPQSKITDADRAAAKEIHGHQKAAGWPMKKDCDWIAAIIAKHMAAERQELEEANECVWRLFEDLRDELKQREAAARKALGKAAEGKANEP